MLEVIDVCKSYGGEPLFENVRLAVPAGSAVAVVGANGCGKSTFLRGVLGIEAFDTGSVVLDGAEFDERDPAVRAAVAADVEELPSFPDLSVREHLELMAHAHAVPEAAAVTENVLRELQLQSAADRMPATLSSGQRRRLAFGAWLVRPRRVLVLDEPEQRLDTDGRAWLADALLTERRNGTAVLFATHDRALVDQVADDVLRIGR
ncbi:MULTISPECIES: ABC transporter ATP-binding protein [Pseudonocardia]|uniref:SkfA peptide export ATP-binding protein SkfE n=2 Tax=Pseudonocardia TaxID=1847 RepID=A0A1Y2MXZ0_PSEAH|nr:MULTISPECIES: ATP-binding cassette domain-containing protein [Pseudonocardia]OSY39508.1 SkfA peptide export ATP-binding protein SkfE [Pseudonocardia autotrophica]TDN75254.1 ABC-type multidrug transport system ATPase subunit [Pseudonocardia autotrophica]BBF99199.1 multidrug ABC transporter ATP-binding protein [Pseudonocardia autotrophica]GEC24745.1 multidrug ABC transporter ATP-binding protein [Pseudonocardia saturnea]